MAGTDPPGHATPDWVQRLTSIFRSAGGPTPGGNGGGGRGGGVGGRAVGMDGVLPPGGTWHSLETGAQMAIVSPDWMLHLLERAHGRAGDGSAASGGAAYAASGSPTAGAGGTDAGATAGRAACAPAPQRTVTDPVEGMLQVAAGRMACWPMDPAGSAAPGGGAQDAAPRDGAAGAGAAGAAGSSADPALRRRACAQCGDTAGTKLRACTGCQRVHYCSRACQRSAWGAHRAGCKAAQAARAAAANAEPAEA